MSFMNNALRGPAGGCPFYMATPMHSKEKSTRRSHTCRSKPFWKSKALRGFGKVSTLFAFVEIHLYYMLKFLV